MVKALARVSRQAALAVLAAVTAAAAAEPHPVAQQMRVFGLVLEESTFRDAQSRLGPIEVRHNGGDAAGSAYFACYRGGDGAMLILASSGEMGGGTHLTSYQLVTREAFADFSWEGPERAGAGRPRCSPLRRLSRASHTDGGLRLGMRRQAVLQLLGRPTESSPDSLAFRLRTELPATRTPSPDSSGAAAMWTRIQYVDVRFEAGRVVAIQASQVTAG